MEKLSFKITLEGTNSPNGAVYINDKIQALLTCVDKETVEFEIDCNEENTLRIDLMDKSPDDVVLDNDGNILKDKLLHIKSIEIDDIDVTNLAHMHSEYDAGEFGVHKLCMDLGWNGAWKLDFNTPFYIWLLETM